MKLVKKQTIIDYFEEKSGYSDHHVFWPIEWRIKLDRWVADVSGKPECDDAWELFVEAHPQLCDMFCEDALSGLVGKPRQYDQFAGHSDKDLANATYLIWQTGKSGGWMVLDYFNGSRFRNTQMSELDQEWPYEDLWVLYKFCLEIDKLVKDRHSIIKQMYQEYRENWEEGNG